MLNDYRRRRDELLQQYFRQETSAEIMELRQAEISDEVRQLLEEEIMAILAPPQVSDLIERVHFLTQFDIGSIQNAIWSLIGKDQVSLDSHLRVIPAYSGSVHS